MVCVSSVPFTETSSSTRIPGGGGTSVAAGPVEVAREDVENKEEPRAPAEKEDDGEIGFSLT